MAKEKKKPAFRRRLGNIQVAVWANEGQNGEVRFDSTLNRRYRDGETWKESSSFGRDELPVARALADMAYTWICEQLASSGEEGEA